MKSDRSQNLHVRLMKTPIIIILISFGLLVMPVLTGCRDTGSEQSLKSAFSSPRLVKVSFCGPHGCFRLRINQQPVKELRNGDFTNAMIHLQLGYGDIVVWEDQRDERGKELNQPEGISRWWFKHLEEARASFYSINSDAVSNFFATRIYHWKASPDKPRPLQDARFFVNGIALGQGSTGFHTMLADIERQKSGPIFIVAPRIKNEGQASSWIAEDQLTTWADSAGVKAEFEKILDARYVELLDFGRLEDRE